MTLIGRGMPAMMPVRMHEKTVFGKSGCSSMGDEHRRHAVERGDVLLIDAWLARVSAKRNGSGSMVEPCVTQAVIASTMPKQWNIGTMNHHAIRGGEIHAVADALCRCSRCCSASA
jgi:hypothetical protein